MASNSRAPAVRSARRAAAHEPSRIGSARARARTAKVGLGAVAALVFGVAFAGARTHAPGHTRRPAKPLGAPSGFEQAVRQSALQAGQIAPPVQPPAVVSSTS